MQIVAIHLEGMVFDGPQPNMVCEVKVGMVTHVGEGFWQVIV